MNRWAGALIFVVSVGLFGGVGAQADALLLRDIRVIDGLGNEALDGRDVLIVEGTIRRVVKTGNDLGTSVGEETQVIEASRLTVLPGLIDLHTHLGRTTFPLPAEDVGSAALADLHEGMRALLYAGITTTMDLGNDHEMIVRARDLQRSGKLSGPRIIATGENIERLRTLSNVFELPSVGQAEIEARLDRHQADGIEIVKLYAGLSNWSARHVMREAHRRGMRGIADFWCSNLSKDVFEVVEVDAFAHGACTRLERSEAQWMYENNKFAMMTLTIFEAMGGHRQLPDYEIKGFLGNPLITDVIGRSVVENYYQTFHAVRDAFYDAPDSLYKGLHFPQLSGLLEINFANLRLLHESGVLLGMGTDGNFPAGNFFGDSLHREMELHVAAGLSPIETIKIATHNGAKILGLDDQIGAIQEGMRADLLVVEGDPAINISDTRNITFVIQDGTLVDREALTKAALDRKNNEGE